MSLLDKSNADVIVFLEEPYTSSDGNLMTRPSATGIPTRATVQPISVGRDDADERGATSVELYRVRFPRTWTHEVRQGSALEWNDERWSFVGPGVKFGGSPKTAHTDYTIRRA